MRLLLVEDEVEIQGFLQRSLTEAGYQVEAAGDSNESSIRKSLSAALRGETRPGLVLAFVEAGVRAHGAPLRRRTGPRAELG
jgi:DNA-binding response OmpR family regulator